MVRAPGLGMKISDSYRPGKLLFTGNVGGLDGFLTGTVHQFSIDAQRGSPWGALDVTGTFGMSGVKLTRGPDPSALWQALASWVKENPRDHKWPPEVLALLELAQRHPEEYEELREGESVIQALGG